jgi:hypothetical protein
MLLLRRRQTVGLLAHTFPGSILGELNLMETCDYVRIESKKTFLVCMKLVLSSLHHSLVCSVCYSYLFKFFPEYAFYKKRLFNRPQLWNSNFFMSNETMYVLRSLMDAWLPDFKFGPGKCALELSRTPWYWVY